MSISYQLQFPDVPHIPTQITIQEGAIKQFKIRVKKFGDGCLLVTGKTGAKKSGALDQVTQALKEEGISWKLYDEVEVNPSIENLSRCVEKYKNDESIKFVVGIGGGSVLDGAKAICFGLSGYDFMAPGGKNKYPLLCVATAVGTGSEVTQYSIVTDPAAETKKSIPNHLFPSLSFIDPNFLKSVPKEQMESMYFDITAHALESAVNNKATDVTFKYSTDALERLKSCREILSGSRDIEHLTEMCLAAVYAGVSIAMAGTSLPHGISYYYTYYHGVPHGIACAIVQAKFLRMCCQEDKVNKLLDAYGLDLPGFERLVAHFLPKNLPKVSEETKRDYAKRVIDSGKCVSINPNMTVEQVLQVWS